MPDNMPDTGAKTSARDAAVERALAFQDTVEDGGAATATADPPAPETTDTVPAEEAPATDEADKATDPDVSAAARTLAKRSAESRAKLREQVRQEMVEAGEIEADDAEEAGDEPATDASTTAETEEEPGSEPATASDAAVQTEGDADKMEEVVGIVSVSDPSELPTNVPSGAVWVEIPADNPLRSDRGHTHMLAIGGTEEYVRSQLNNPTRNREVQEAQTRAAKLERDMAALKARIKARDSEEFRALEKNPEIQRLIEDAKEAGYSDETVKLLREGMEAQARLIEDKYADEAISEAEAMATVNQFWSQVNQHAPQRYKAWAERGELGARINQAINDPNGGYKKYLNAVGTPPDIAEFFTRYLDAEYARDPSVQAYHKRQQESQSQKETESKAAARAAERELEKKKLKEEIRAELLKEAEEVREKRANNPMGKVPSAQAGSRPSDDQGGQQTPATPTEYRKRQRERALDRIGGV